MCKGGVNPSDAEPNNKCPIESGQIIVGMVQENVPGIARSGKYTVRSIINANGRDIECIEFDLYVEK
jgi:hypothetical protein